MELVCGARFKFGDEMEIEVACLRCLGVDQESPTTDVLTDAQQSGDRVSKEAGSYPSAFVLGVNTESGEERHWLGVTPCSLA
jgi:hypothetical protein